MYTSCISLIARTLTWKLMTQPSDVWVLATRLQLWTTILHDDVGVTP